jgi:hypothetical protein
LLISPEYFVHFKEQHPKISSVQLIPKLGKATNEMNCYRYDVVLRVGEDSSTTETISAEKFMPVLDLQSFIEQQHQNYLAIRYPNQKIASEYFNYQSLCGQQHDLSREVIAGLCTVDRIKDIFSENGYQVAFHLDITNPLYLNLVAYRGSESAEVEINYKQIKTTTSRQANNPIFNITATEDRINEKLLTHLRKYLPEYMLPSYFIALEEFPLTVSGKLNQCALPKPVQSFGRESFPPTSQTEAVLCDIFAQILGLPSNKIGIKDDFFMIGGNSLLVFRLLSKVNDYFNRKIQPCHFFANKTVERLAKLLAVLSGEVERRSSQRERFLAHTPPSESAPRFPLYPVVSLCSKGKGYAEYIQR